MAIIAVYRPYVFKDPTLFLQSLDCLLNNVKYNRNIILLGDINIDIAQGYISSFTIDYLDTLAQHGLFLRHDLSTHGYTCLNHVNLKTTPPSKVFVLETTVTDHFAVLLTMFLKNA